MPTAFLEPQTAIHRRFEPQMESHAQLHVLLSAQIKIGHATVWMRTKVCASFILRPSLLPFGFALWFARILRETFAEKERRRSVRARDLRRPSGNGVTTKA
jgi:hypothetical protein